MSSPLPRTLKGENVGVLKYRKGFSGSRKNKTRKVLIMSEASIQNVYSQRSLSKELSGGDSVISAWKAQTRNTTKQKVIVVDPREECVVV